MASLNKTENTSEQPTFNDGSEIRQAILQSIQEFKKTEEQMRSNRQQYQEQKKKRLADRKAHHKKELLFTKKTEGLSKKAEFRSTIPSQQSLCRDLFSKATFNEHGPLMELREREALIAPDRVFVKGIFWKPTDDVIFTQRHMFFQDTLEKANKDK